MTNDLLEIRIIGMMMTLQKPLSLVLLFAAIPSISSARPIIQSGHYRASFEVMPIPTVTTPLQADKLLTAGTPPMIVAALPGLERSGGVFYPDKTVIHAAVNSRNSKPSSPKVQAVNMSNAPPMDAGAEQSWDAASNMFEGIRVARALSCVPRPAQPRSTSFGVPSVAGAPWDEFRRGFFGLGIYPARAKSANEAIDESDRMLWTRTLRTGNEYGLWEALDSHGKRLVSAVFGGAHPDHLSDTAAILKKVLEHLSRKGVAYSNIAKFRFRHTHPSGASDRFSNGDIQNNFAYRKYFDDVPGLRHVDLEASIVYWPSWSTGDKKVIRKRAFILPAIQKR